MNFLEIPLCCFLRFNYLLIWPLYPYIIDCLKFLEYLTGIILLTVYLNLNCEMLSKNLVWIVIIKNAKLLLR